jgi:hypothetical protein
MLVAQGKRQYAEGGTDFDDIPPHHIVIQGRFIRLFHDEMKALPGKLKSKLVVVGFFHLVSPDGQASVRGEESDEEPMVDEIVADVMSGQSRCFMTGSGEELNETLADEQATIPFTNSSSNKVAYFVNIYIYIYIYMCRRPHTQLGLHCPQVPPPTKPWFFILQYI